MTVYRMNRPTSFLTTMKFRSYNAAIAFCQGSGLLNPTKPYKRMMLSDGEYVAIWCVTMPSVSPASKASYTRCNELRTAA